MKQLTKLTEDQLNQLRKIVKNTLGSQRKNARFANAVEGFATRTISTPKAGAKIYRVSSHNYGTKQQSDWGDALTSEGLFIGFNGSNVVTELHPGWRRQDGISTGRFINVTDAAHDQLIREFSDYIVW